MRSRGKPKMIINPQEQRQLSTQDVQILSNPELIKMLESFQSGEEMDTEMLKNLKLLKLFRNLHVPDPNSAKVEVQDTENPSLSTPGLIPADEIKVEGKKKRELSGFDEFQEAWKSTPKTKKKDSDSVKYSIGSPSEGIVLTKDQDLVQSLVFKMYFAFTNAFSCVRINLSILLFKNFISVENSRQISCNPKKF